MSTTTSTESDVAWDTIFDDNILCEAAGHETPHPAQWYAAFGCTNCDTWDTDAICDAVRKMFEAQMDELVHCPCGIKDVPFKTFFHGFTPVRG